MTDGPYDNSIRSQSNSGLGGIWAAITALTGGLGALPQIAADLRILVGATQPPGWVGLGWYLHRAVNGVDESEITGYSMTRYLKDIKSLELDLIYALAGNSNHIPGGLNVLTTIRNATESHAAQYIAENASRADMLVAQLKVAAVLGLLADSPNGSTIKDLLRSMDVNILRTAICCEDGPIVSDPYPTPTTNCFGQTVSWQECTLELRDVFTPAGNGSFWAVVFPASMTADIGIGAVNMRPGFFDPGLGELSNEAATATTYKVCIAWHFADAAEPDNYGICICDRDDANSFNGYTSATGATDNPGSELSTLPLLSGGGARLGYQVNFKFLTDTPPAGKVWCAIVPQL